MSKQKQMFERFNQRKRFDFEQMKKNFNINSIEVSEQMKQSSFKRRDRSFERERRERCEDNKNEARNEARDETRDETRNETRSETRNDARNNARNDVKNDVKDDATDETNALMKNVS